ncbi:MAG TPA: T9SS type A sorting domain-containing protein, partial [Bacillota bacterium]|nr:T9SS type A sorting domain-containing protein [Bacillota bacterium]
ITRTGDNIEIRRLINPFRDKISFDLLATQDGPATFTLLDNYGRVIRQFKSRVLKGFNHVALDQLNNIGKATYYLRVEANNEILNRMVIKSQ